MTRKQNDFATHTVPTAIRMMGFVLIAAIIFHPQSNISLDLGHNPSFKIVQPDKGHSKP
jgi:hypothetical protein